MLQIFKTTDDVLKGLADYIVEVAEQPMYANDRFTISLSGGSSPKSLYQLLASEEYRDKINWEKVYFFFGDERMVPADDQDNNGNMVRQALFNKLQIPENQVFFIDTSLPPKEAAKDYQERLQAFFGEDEIVFDLVLLGLGDNSHTASLFPHTDIINETEVGVRAVYLKDQKVYRISMTAPMINQAKHIAFLVYGTGKAEAVFHVLKDEKNHAKYPAQLIQPNGGDVIWFLDEEASARVH